MKEEAYTFLEKQPITGPVDDAQRALYSKLAGKPLELCRPAPPVTFKAWKQYTKQQLPEVVNARELCAERVSELIEEEVSGLDRCYVLEGDGMYYKALLHPRVRKGAHMVFLGLWTSSFY